MMNGFRARREFNATSGKCFYCGKFGHWACECRSNPRNRNSGFNGAGNFGTMNSQRNSTNAIDESFGHLKIENNTNDEFDTDALIAQIDTHIGENRNEGNVETMNVKVNSVVIKFEVDTGSKFTVIRSRNWQRFLGNEKLVECYLPLSVVSGEKLKILGKVFVSIEDQEKSKMEIFVIESK